MTFVKRLRNKEARRRRPFIYIERLGAPDSAPRSARCPLGAPAEGSRQSSQQAPAVARANTSSARPPPPPRLAAELVLWRASLPTSERARARNQGQISTRARACLVCSEAQFALHWRAKQLCLGRINVLAALGRADQRESRRRRRRRRRCHCKLSRIKPEEPRQYCKSVHVRSTPFIYSSVCARGRRVSRTAATDQSSTITRHKAGGRGERALGAPLRIDLRLLSGSGDVFGRAAEVPRQFIRPSGGCAGGGSNDAARAREAE